MRHRRSHAAAVAAVAACFLANAAVVKGRREVETDASLEQEIDVSFTAAEDTASANDTSLAAAGSKASATGAEGKARASAAAGAATTHSADSWAGSAAGVRHLVALAIAAFHKAEQRSAPGTLAECSEDSSGERLGCSDGSCSCFRFERCYPKRGRDLGVERNVGVCSPGLAVLVATSLVIIASALGCIVILRVFFQWRERIRALMSKNQPYECGGEEEDEHDPADTNPADAR